MSGKRARLAGARTCYDHLAGALGVAVTEAMTDRRLISRQDTDGDRGDGRGGDRSSRRGGSGDVWALTPEGVDWLRELEIDVSGTLEAARRTHRPVARGCLDWTERRPHLAGAAGAAVCARFFAAGWIERVGPDRAVRLTDAGAAALRDRLGLRLRLTKP